MAYNSVNNVERAGCCDARGFGYEAEQHDEQHHRTKHAYQCNVVKAHEHEGAHDNGGECQHEYQERFRRHYYDAMGYILFYNNV